MHARCSMKCVCEYFGLGSDVRAWESIDSWIYLLIIIPICWIRGLACVYEIVSWNWHKACGGPSLVSWPYLRLPVSLLNMILVVIYMHPNCFPFEIPNDVNWMSNGIRKNVVFLLACRDNTGRMNTWITHIWIRWSYLRINKMALHCYV